LAQFPEQTSPESGEAAFKENGPAFTTDPFFRNFNWRHQPQYGGGPSLKIKLTK